jgi:hypothetical protein
VDGGREKKASRQWNKRVRNESEGKKPWEEMLTSMGIFRHPQSEESSIKEIRISKKGLWFIIMIGNEISRRKSHGDV